LASLSLNVAKNALYVETKISIVFKMGKINLEIDDSLEKEFRKMAVEKFEARKGFLKKAVEEALWEWLRKNQRK